jgi:hypothetical protein
MRPLLLLLGLLFAATAHGENLASNPDMELGTQIPAGWGASNDSITVTRDTSIRHTGKASLRVATRKADADGSASMAVELQPGRTYRVSGWCRGIAGKAGLRKASFAVLCQDNLWRSLVWVDLVPTSQIIGEAWRQISGTATIPAGTVQTQLLLFVQGEGTVWLDAIEVVDASGAPAAPIPPTAAIAARAPTVNPSTNLLRNGGMEVGQRFPAEWQPVSDAKQLEAELDRQNPHSGVNALRLSGMSSAADGNVAVPLDLTGSAGRTIHLQAWIRREANDGIHAARLSFLAQGAGWKQIEWKDLVDISDLRATQWTRVTASHRLPEGITQGLVMLYIQGHGRVWIDDVIITLDQPPAASDLPLTAVQESAVTSTTVPDGTKLLTDPGFERWSNDLPVGWVNESPQAVTIRSDAKDKKQGRYSMQIEVRPKTGDAPALTLTLPNAPGRRVQIRGWAKAKLLKRGLDQCHLAVISIGAAGEQLWLSGLNKSEDLTNPAWRRFTGTAEIHERAVKTTLRLVIAGSGILWLDDVQVEVLPAR